MRSTTSAPWRRLGDSDDACTAHLASAVLMGTPSWSCPLSRRYATSSGAIGSRPCSRRPCANLNAVPSTAVCGASAIVSIDLRNDRDRRRLSTCWSRLTRAGFECAPSLRPASEQSVSDDHDIAKRTSSFFPPCPEVRCASSPSCGRALPRRMNDAFPQLVRNARRHFLGVAASFKIRRPCRALSS